MVLPVVVLRGQGEQGLLHELRLPPISDCSPFPMPLWTLMSIHLNMVIQQPAYIGGHLSHTAAKASMVGGLHCGYECEMEN